jgi:hypothetical protein
MRRDARSSGDIGAAAVGSPEIAGRDSIANSSAIRASRDVTGFDAPAAGGCLVVARFAECIVSGTAFGKLNPDLLDYNRSRALCSLVSREAREAFAGLSA